MNIERSDLDKYLEHIKEANVYEKKISNRINYILREVFPRHFKGFKLIWWDYATYDYNSEEQGKLDYALRYKNTIEIRSDWNQPKLIILKDYISDLIQAFPLGYLFMSDDDLESELTKIVDKAIANEEKRKNDLKLAKEKDKKLKAKALNKLTKEEKKVLGLK